VAREPAAQVLLLCAVTPRWGYFKTLVGVIKGLLNVSFIVFQAPWRWSRGFKQHAATRKGFKTHAAADLRIRSTGRTWFQGLVGHLA